MPLECSLVDDTDNTCSYVFDTIRRASIIPTSLFSRLCEKPKSSDTLLQGIYVHYCTTELHQ